MVAGHLREQNGYYQIILNWKDDHGKRKSKSISTGLPVKGNKKRAEAMLMAARNEFKPEKVTPKSELPFDEFLSQWLKDRVALLNPAQYAGVAYNVKTKIMPYFSTHKIQTGQIGADHLEQFFRFERNENKASVSLLLALHECIFDCLLYATELGWLKGNPAELVNPCSEEKSVLFIDFLNDWLKIMRPSVKRTTFSSYERVITKAIVPYFQQKHPGLQLNDLSAKHIQDFYISQLDENGVSANTVKHYHANIHKALRYAFTMDLIPYNPADKVQLPKVEKYVGNYYNAKQLETMFSIFKGDMAEFGVVTASFYGLRRSEIVGLRWDAIDFERKTITIRHTVTETNENGKLTLVMEDSTKTKSSYRSLPLVPKFEEILLRMKKEQQENMRLCGNSYCKEYLDYIYVNPIGELIKPGFLTTHVPYVLKKNNMPKIRFHDLRHSCATLLFANGVSLKDIQAWLGHSTIGTTANIYTHLDENSKLASAEAIMPILCFGQ